jgi:N-acetylglutamate synthase-like GNAT family acetyltransferase
MMSGVVRAAAAADEAQVAAILAEYCDALAVVIRDTAEDMRGYLVPPSGLWLAQVGVEIVGCVALRPLSVRVGEIKRLYVRQAQRGQGLADALLDALERSAREGGLQKLYLDTHDGLLAAKRFYERRGYSLRERYNDNPQATLFMERDPSAASKDSFAGHEMSAPWDALHRAYFNGEALWTYLTTPFLLATHAVRVEDTVSWRDGSDVWRVLRAYFPGSVETHGRVQEFFFGQDLMLRRHDYSVNIAGGFAASQLTSDYATANGFRFAHETGCLHARARSTADPRYADGLDRHRYRPVCRVSPAPKQIGRPNRLRLSASLFTVCSPSGQIVSLLQKRGEKISALK